MQTRLIALVLLLGCDGDPVQDLDGSGGPADAVTLADCGCLSDAAPDASLRDLGFEDTADIDAGAEPGDAGHRDMGAIAADAGQPSGEISGEWCGNITLADSVTVPAGQILTVCAGAHITATGAPGTAITVLGTLQIQGMAEAPVVIEGADWRGIRVGGIVDAEHFELRGATRCLESQPGSEIRVRDALIEGCGTALTLADSANFERTTIRGGGSARISGGVLGFTDVRFDLEHDRVSPDCIVFAGGGAIISHSRITGCHCPLHINRGGQFEVTDSVLDQSAYSVMISDADAVFRRCHFEAVENQILDIGGGFSADIAGNYWGGGPPNLRSGDLNQFEGAARFSAEPFAGVGPR